MKLDQEQSKGAVHYLQQVGLVILGAIISIVPSFVMANRQAEIQMKQFILDRQVSTLKEYSASLNQIGGKQLSGVRELFDELEMLEAKAELEEDENLPDDEEKIKQLQGLLRNLLTSSDEFIGNLNTQRTMVYAVFGCKLEPTTPPILTEEEVKKLQERWKKGVDEAGTDLEGIRNLKRMMRELEGIIARALYGHNKDVESLALKIQEQQNSF